MHFGATSGFGAFSPATQQQQQQQQQQATVVSPSALTEERKRVIFNTARRCGAMYTAAKRAAADLERLLLGPARAADAAAEPSPLLGATSATARHTQLRRAVLLAHYAFGKCQLRVERYGNCAQALETLLRMLLAETQKGPVESFFVAPLLKDLQQRPPMHQRALARLHHVAIVAVTQNMRIRSVAMMRTATQRATQSQQQQDNQQQRQQQVVATTTSCAEMAANLLHVMGRLGAATAAAPFPCVTVPQGLSEKMVGVLAKLITLAQSQIGAGCAKELLEYPVSLFQTNNNNNNNSTTRRYNSGIVDLLNALWERDTVATVTGCGAVTRTLLLKYTLALAVEHLKAAAQQQEIVQATRLFLLFAVTRLPWFSVDRRIRSVFADFDVSHQTALAEVLPLVFSTDLLLLPGPGASVMSGGGRAWRLQRHQLRWLPGSPSLSGIFNFISNYIFFTTTCMVGSGHDAGRWAGLLAELLVALHPSKQHPALAQRAAARAQAQQSLVSNTSAAALAVQQLSRAGGGAAAGGSGGAQSSAALFDALFINAINGSGPTAGSALTTPWASAVARLWDEQIVGRALGIFIPVAVPVAAAAAGGGAAASSFAAPPRTNAGSSRGEEGGGSAEAGDANKISFGQMVRGALQRLVNDNANNLNVEARPEWLPTAASRSAPLPELQLVANNSRSALFWFTFCSFLSAAASRAKLMSVLNALYQVTNFSAVATLWKKFMSPTAGTGRRWIERAVTLVAEGGGSRAQSADLELEVASDFVACAALLFSTLSHSLLVCSDSDLRAGWPLPHNALDGCVGFCNTCVLLVVALDTNHRARQNAQHSGNAALRDLYEQLDVMKTNMKRFLRLFEDRDIRMSLVPAERRDAGFWALEKNSLKWANSLVEAGGGAGAAATAGAARSRDDGRAQQSALLSKSWIKALSTHGSDQRSALAALTTGTGQAQQIADFNAQTSQLALNISHELSHAVPFELRVSVLRAAFFRQKQDRMRGRNFVHIRRDAVVEDVYRAFMQNVGAQNFGGGGAAAVAAASNDVRDFLRSHIQVTFLRSAEEGGAEEAGIDGGGLLKMLFDDFGSAESGITSPHLGLFRFTSDRSALYPSASAAHVFDGSHFAGGGVQAADLFRCIGRVIAKAIFEGITLSIPLATFFLTSALGRVLTLEDLSAIDPQLYQSLSRLKDMDAEALTAACLVFADEENVLGQTRVVPLIPGGEDIDVTNENVVRYISLLSHYRMTRAIKPFTDAFVLGLTDVIDRQHLALFNGRELRQLISGSEDMDWDVDELMESATLTGYTSASAPVRYLREALLEFTREERAQFLAFVTGSGRPPLLGFASMHPSFQIICWSPADAAGRQQQQQERGFFSRMFGGDDVQHLPAAATCFSQLKLPPYSSKANLVEKLRIAIQSRSFELA